MITVITWIKSHIILSIILLTTLTTIAVVPIVINNDKEEPNKVKEGVKEITCDESYILDENNECIKIEQEEIHEEPKEEVKEEPKEEPNKVKEEKSQVEKKNETVTPKTEPKEEVKEEPKEEPLKQYTVKFYKEVGKCSCDVTYTLDKIITVDSGTSIFVPNYSGCEYCSYTDQNKNYVNDTVSITKDLEIYYHSPCGSNEC